MGKGKGGGPKTYDYFGTLGCLVCAGPVDEILTVIVDGKTMWEGKGNGTPAGLGVHANGYSIFTVQNLGEVRFYWGNATQVADAVLNDNEFGEVHPAYRGWCYAVLVKWFFGRERPQAPNVEVIVRRAPRGPDGVPVGLLDGEANPAGVAQEALADPRFGLDLPPSEFAPSWTEALGVVKADANRNFISPLLETQLTARELGNTLGELGEFRVINDGGLIGATAWTREVDSTQAGSWPQIRNAQLVERAKIELPQPAALPNQWSLQYTDRTRAYKPDVVRVATLDVRAIPGGLRNEALQRDWITRQKQAMAWLESWSSRRGRPARRVTLRVRRGFADLLAPGDLFLCDVDVKPGGTALLSALRVVRRRLPAGNAPAEIYGEEENTFTPIVVPDSTYEPVLPSELPEPVLWTRLLEMPPDLVDGKANMVTPLLAREDNTTVGCGLYLRRSDDLSAELLGWQRQIVLRGRLAADVAAAATSITLTITRLRAEGIEDENDLLDADPGQQSAENNDFMAILIECSDTTFGTVAADTAGQIVEFMAISATTDATAAGATSSTWNITGLRGRLGWPARAWVASRPVEVWIVRKVDLGAYEHALLASAQPVPTVTLGRIGRDFFETAPRAEPTVQWRLVPFNDSTAWDIDNLAANPPWRVWEYGASAYAPKIEWIQPPTPADGQSFTAPSSFDWRAVVRDSDNNLASIRVTLTRAGDSPIILHQENTAPVGEREVGGIAAKITGEGTWTLLVRATDTAGEVGQASLTFLAAGATNALAPSIIPVGGYYKRLTKVSMFLNSAPGIIRWKQGYPGESVPPRPWTSSWASGASALLNKSGWLAAYTSDVPGLADSETNIQNFSIH
jgi:hypothetical protein